MKGQNVNRGDLTPKRSRFIFTLGQGLGVIGPVRTGLLYRSTQGVTTALTLICIATILTSAEQGYFFTFLGILAAQQLLELGLAAVIMQMASHESVGLRWKGRIAEYLEPGVGNRLTELLVLARRWYGAIAAIFLITVIPAGWFVLSGGSHSEVGDSWKGPWLIAGAVFAINFAIVPVLALLEGCGKISEVYVFRSWQEMAASLGLWISLLGGLGLYSLGIYLALRAISGAIYLGLYRGFLALLWGRRVSDRDFSWSREIWPFQWRISVSWGAGYLIFWLTTPIVFSVLGPVAAGQWALTYQIVYNIAQFWLTWVAARAPELGNLAAQRKYREMEAMFFHGAKRSIAACAVALGVSYLALRMAFDFQLPYVDRFIEPTAAAILTAWALTNHAVNAMAIYLRAHREEPYLLPSLAGAILLPPAVYLFGGKFGVEGIALSYLVSGCLIGLGWGGLIFWRKILACRVITA